MFDSLGAFVRILVSVTDKPRNVKKFEIESEATQSKRSDIQGRIRERSRRLRIPSSSDQDALWEYTTEEEINESMPDLAKKLTTPLLPDVHAEGWWVHFELKKAKHELKRCNVVTYAIDALNRRNEIDTSSLEVRDIEDSEYIRPSSTSS